MGALVLAYNGLAVIAEGLWRSPLSHCKNSERCFLGLYPISTNTDSIKASFLLISPFFIVIQLWVEAVRLVPPGDLLQMLFHKVVVSRCVSHTKPNNTNNASIVPFLWLVSRGRDCCHKTPQSCYRNGQAEETVLWRPQKLKGNFLWTDSWKLQGFWLVIHWNVKIPYLNEELQNIHTIIYM